jgi:hypothetical protein
MSLLAALLAASTLSVPAAELPHAELAETFLQRHGLEGRSPEEVQLGAVLSEHFVAADVGLFQVWIPRTSLEDRVRATDFRDCCAALCEAQARWVGWLDGSARDGEPLTEALEQHRRWISKWPVRELTAGEAGNALDLLGADEEARAASDAAAAALRLGSVLGLSFESPAPVRLVLMPERARFVEFLAFTGWHNPDLRSIYWAPGVETWTEFRIQDLQVIALEYPAVAPAPGDHATGSSMKDRHPKGLEQQVVQLGMNQLLAHLHGASMPDAMVRALSINLLIDQYGECHTRNDGDLRGRVTGEREIFVHGGRSEGGLLPPNVAENRWRSDHGKHRYTRILKQAQRSGASQDKRNKHRYNAFLLFADDDREQAVAHAPIYGPGPGEPEVLPEAFAQDLSEFLRAYDVAFLHHLRTAGAGSKTRSAEAFAQLLGRLTSGADSPGFAKAVEEVYGAPLSDPEVGTDSVEGRYLKWLSKQ